MNPKGMVEYMDKVLAKLDPEKKKREDERAKENQHRKEEGLAAI